jgi:hypothetical protein
MNTPTLTGTYTCTHHNDAERTACPVCLVTAITAERDELRAALALGQENCDAVYDELRGDCDELRADVVRLTARAERAEAAETVALAHWNKELERAMKAEAEVERLRSDRDCEKRLRKDAEEFRENAIARAERYRLASLKLDAELAAERARLDWVFRNCKVTADDYTTGNRDVYAIHDREDLGVAMKEGAK